jgi:tetratricopeptide (TPR) repeat protein
MADGLIEGALGADDAEVRDAEAALGAADTTAMAVALDIARTSREAGLEAAAYLKHHAILVAEQTRLVRLQLHHFNKDRLSADRATSRKRFSDLMKNTLQALVTLAALSFTIAIGIMVYDAVQSRAVVVEAFDAPPALASQGVSGKVVASAVLDTLQKLANATRSQEKGLAAENAWSSDVQIVVPETGVSIGEIDRLLHQRFGHDMHVGGDLVQTPGGGLALTVRGDGLPPKTFPGGAGDLDKLTTKAAEYVYGSSQPLKFAVYLGNENRSEDALKFIPIAFAQATDDVQRSRLANTWGNVFYSQNKPAEAVKKYRLAIALDGSNWLARSNLVNALPLTEGEEVAWKASRDFEQASAAAPASQRPETRMLGGVATNLWDMPLALEAVLADAARNGGAGISTTIDGPPIADTYAAMHDPAHAERYIDASDPSDPTTVAEALMLQAYAALDRNDAAAAVAPLEAYWKAWQADPDLQVNSFDAPCYLGLAYGLSGRLAEADALFKRLGAWNRCFAYHGAVLAHAGDFDGANRVWAEGQRAAADLPNVYLYRGLSEMARGKLDAAGADFAAANTSAPHFADPLKAWGDLLALQGNWKSALAKYNEALKFAPNWAALKQARVKAVKKS